MLELGWIQLGKMEKIELTKGHWERAKEDNKNLIAMNLIQIEMAYKVMDLCDAKIKEFPEEEKTEEKSQ